MEVKWIEHKNTKILYVDYRGAKSENDMLEILKQEVEIDRSISGTAVILADYEGSFVSMKYMDELKKTGTEIRNSKITKIALLGITGVKKILTQAYINFTGNKNIKIFQDEITAKEWLAK